MVKYNVEIKLPSGEMVYGRELSNTEAQNFLVGELARHYSFIPVKMSRNVLCNLSTRPGRAYKVLQNLVKVSRA